jgi:hypothetical protein
MVRSLMTNSNIEIWTNIRTLLWYTYHPGKSNHPTSKQMPAMWLHLHILYTLVLPWHTAHVFSRSYACVCEFSDISVFADDELHSM